jgi:hypothetical protein
MSHYDWTKVGGQVTPAANDIVDEEFDIEGRYDGKYPNSATVWIIGQNSQGQYWFETEVNFFLNNTWIARVHFHPEYGTRQTFWVAILGEAGKVLRDYYMNSGWVRHSWPPLTRLTPDVERCDSVLLRGT